MITSSPGVLIVDQRKNPRKVFKYLCFLHFYDVFFPDIDPITPNKKQVYGFKKINVPAVLIIKICWKWTGFGLWRIRALSGINGRDSQGRAKDAVKEGAPGTWTPEKVANVTYKAATSIKPKVRYRPGMVSKALIYSRYLLPYRMWDSMFVNTLTKQGRKFLAVKQ